MSGGWLSSVQYDRWVDGMGAFSVFGQRDRRVEGTWGPTACTGRRWNSIDSSAIWTSQLRAAPRVPPAVGRAISRAVVTEIWMLEIFPPQNLLSLLLRYFELLLYPFQEVIGLDNGCEDAPSTPAPPWLRSTGNRIFAEASEIEAKFKKPLAYSAIFLAGGQFNW